MIRIVDWEKSPEQGGNELNRSRGLKAPGWFPKANNVNAKRVSRILDHRDGLAHFGVWCVLEMLASASPQRGEILWPDGLAMTPEDICRHSCRFSEGSPDWEVVLGIVRCALQRFDILGFTAKCQNPAPSGTIVPTRAGDSLSISLSTSGDGAHARDAISSPIDFKPRYTPAGPPGHPPGPENRSPQAAGARPTLLDEGWERFREGWEAFCHITPSASDWRFALLAWRRLDGEQKQQAVSWLTESSERLTRAARAAMPQNYLEKGMYQRQERRTAKRDEHAEYMAAVDDGFEGTLEEWRKSV